jgi:hypothetical protein
MKTIVTVAVLILSAGLLNDIATHRNAELMRTASLYEQCVKSEYGMTPIRWYAEHHKYPVCVN